MVCDPASVAQAPTPPGIELLIPRADAELRATLAAQNEAYNDLDPTPSQEAVARLRANMEEGQIVVLARVEATGEGVGGSMHNPPR